MVLSGMAERNSEENNTIIDEAVGAMIQIDKTIGFV